MADAPESIYFFDPSLPAAILFTILYAVPAGFLFYTTVIGPRTGKYHHARFFIPVCIGAVMEVAGYIVRCISVQRPRNIPLYAVSSSLIVLAPVFICASLYLLIGRLVRAGIPMQGKQQRILGISPHWLPRGFITSDILSFMTQGSGSGIASSGGWEGTEKETGTNVLIGGLALQLATFSLFMIIVWRFHVRAKAIGNGVDKGVHQVLIGIYAAGFFIWVSSSGEEFLSKRRQFLTKSSTRFDACTV
jgi:hypothetical protein